jgi:class 3 adenylate cyclase
MLLRMGDVAGYAMSDGAYIAYEVVGDAPRDLIIVMDGFVPIDTLNDERRMEHCMARLNSFARLIRFDRRGVGLSDPVSPSSPPTLEQWVADAIAVLDAAGSKRAVVLASAEMGTVGLLIAAMHPDRVEALVVVNAYARAMVDTDYPDGLPAEALADLISSSTDGAPTEDAEDFIFLAAPTAADDPHFRRWWQAAGRRGASPATARALLKVELESDVRAVLSTIQAPTLVAHMRDEPLIPMALGRYVADHIAGARWFEVAGADDFWWASDAADIVLDEIEEFITGTPSASPTNRVLSTVLFTDIVSSTERAHELGDHQWRDVLNTHDQSVRRQLTRFRGKEVNTTGDGFVATFDGPARAIACACAIRDAAHQLGLEVRSGVHTGEIELRGDDIAGIAVHIAARVASLATASTVWTSRTVTDLVIGAGIQFRECGDHALKGVPGTWALFEVVDE